MYKLILQKDGKEINSFNISEFFISAVGVDGKKAFVLAQCSTDFIMQTIEALVSGIENGEAKSFTNDELGRVKDLFSPTSAQKAKLRVLTTNKED